MDTTETQKPENESLEMAANTQQFLSVMIADQRFGIPIIEIEDVLRQQKVTQIPLAPPEVAGALNLRGRIVTAVDVRHRLGMEPQNDSVNTMSVVVEHEDELYSLIIDRVGDVLRLKKDLYEPNPATLDEMWRDISHGIYRLENELLVILDIPKLLNTVHN